MPELEEGQPAARGAFGCAAGTDRGAGRRGPTRYLCVADLGALQIEVQVPVRWLARELAALFPVRACRPSQERPPRRATQPGSSPAEALPLRLWVRRAIRRTPCALCGATAPARDSFVILRDDGTARAVGHACEVLSCLEWQVSDLAQQRLPAEGYLLVHAAVLVQHGRALLLPAASGSGKSTLAAALALAGWQYWSDEFAILELATGAVLPYRKAITLRPGGAAALRRFAADRLVPGRFGERTGHEAYRFNGERLRFWLPPAPADGQPARPAWLVLPQYAPDAKPAIEPLRPSETLEALLMHSLSRGAALGRRLPQIVGVVRHLAGARLRYADLAQAAALIDRLCRESAAAGEERQTEPAISSTPATSNAT